MRFLRGPWQWVNGGDMPYWAPPPGFVGLDLRTLAQQSQQGGTPGLGIFYGTGDPGSEYDELGRGSWYEVKATQKLKDTLPVPAGYRPKGDDLVGLIFDLLTDGSDPDGIDGPKPLMPTAQGRIELRLGQSHHERFRWGGNHTPKIKRMLRKEFAGLMQDVQDGKMRAKQHLRIMDFWCDKYNVDDWREFVPDALQADVPGRVPHETTITDTFNRSDGSGLGTSSGGWTWSAVTASWNIASNAAEGQANGALSRADSDLSSSDTYSQADVSNRGNASGGPGTIVRKDSSATLTYYHSRLRGDADFVQLFKFVSATATQLSSDAAVTVTGSNTQKCEASGSTIAAYHNGVSKISTTDTAISSGTRTGVRTSFSSTKPVVDNFEAGDIAASGLLYTQLERGTRGVLRGMYTKW